MGADGENTKTCVDTRSKSWSSKRKGGFRACTFIFGLLAFENMGFIANAVSLVVYFTKEMRFDLATAANTLTNFMGSTFLLSLVGGFISDTYLTRLNTCLLFGTLEVLALIMMTVQAYSHDLQPKPDCTVNCVTGRVAFAFYTSLCMLALGAGGMRGALPALGADQFDQRDPKEGKALASYFNWLLLSVTLGASVGVTAIVYVSIYVKWFWGFFIITLSAFLGYLFLLAGKSFYRCRSPDQSPIQRITQVIVVAIKNRSLELPETPSELYEDDEKDLSFSSPKISHTPQFRFLDKAAILPKNSEPNQQKVCTVTQVEEVKILIRMLPILGSTIIMNTCLAQLQTFSVEQGTFMNLHLGHLKVPPPSIPVIPLFFMSVLIPIYQFFFVPFARKFTKHPAGITQLQRVGVGLVLSAISMAAAGFVEVKRRNQGNKDPTRPISLFWLSFQYGIFGVADMFTLVGLLEFFYKEAPNGMKSLSTSFTWVSMSIGYFLSTILVNIINSVTSKLAPSKQGWLHGFDFNQNNLDLFYWFLAILSFLNFLNYLYWAKWYKYRFDDGQDDEATKLATTSSPCPIWNASKETPLEAQTDESRKLETTFSPCPIQNASKETPLEAQTDESRKLETTFSPCRIENAAKETPLKT